MSILHLSKEHRRKLARGYVRTRLDLRHDYAQEHGLSEGRLMWWARECNFSVTGPRMVVKSYDCRILQVHTTLFTAIQTSPSGMFEKRIGVWDTREAAVAWFARRQSEGSDGPGSGDWA